MTNARSAQAWFEQQGGTDIARHFAALTTNVRGRAASSASTPPSASGTGWAGAIRCGRPSACRSPSPLAREGFRRAAGGRACDGRALPHRAAGAATCRCAWACWTSGTATSTASPAAASRRTTAPCAACRPTCSSWRWRATASASTRRARRCRSPPRRCCGASPAPTASMRTSRCCTRAPTWCRWSSSPCSEAAHDLPGHHEQLLANALAQAQALMQGKADAGGHKQLPGQPAQHLLPAGALDAAQPGRAARAVRAPRVRQRRAVGHQQLRPVGRGAGQGAGQGHRAAAGSRATCRAGCLDGGPAAAGCAHLTAHGVSTCACAYHGAGALHDT